MPIPDFGEYISSNASLEEFSDRISNLEKTVKYHLTGNIATENAREFAGWYIGKQTISSKNMLVGLNSEETGGDDLRIWAGSAGMYDAEFRVYESGKMYATDGYFTGTIVGSTIYTVAAGSRGVMDSSSLAFYDGFNTRRLSMQTSVLVNGNFSPGLAFYDPSGINVANIAAGSSGTFMIDGGGTSSLTLDSALSYISGNSIYLDGSGGNVYVGNPLFGADKVATQSQIDTINGTLTSHGSTLSSHGSTLSDHESRIYALEHAPPPTP